MFTKNLSNIFIDPYRSLLYVVSQGDSDWAITYTALYLLKLRRR